MGDITWTIVTFIEENAVEAVPTTWLFGSQKCYWPPFPREKLMHCIRKHERPNTCWPLHDIVLFRNGTYDDYLVARNKARKAENYSDLNSDSDVKSRKLKKKKAISSSSSDEENDFSSKLPSPPKIPKSTAKTDIETNIFSSIGPLQEIMFPKQPQPSTSVNKKTTEIGFQSCCCCADHKMGDTLKNLVKQQVLTRHILNEVLDDVRKIKLDLNTNTTLSISAKSSIQSIFVAFEYFPVNSDATLGLLEQYLSEKKQFEAAVIEMSKIGGCSPYDFMKRCLNFILTNNFASEFSWQGAKKKKVFGLLKIAVLLLEAAQVNGYDRKSSEEAIKAWLRRAKERHISAIKKAVPPEEDTDNTTISFLP